MESTRNGHGKRIAHRARRALGGLLVALILCGKGAGAQPYLERDLELEGVGVQLRLSALDARQNEAPQAGEELELRLSLRRLADGQPLSGLPIGVWVDRELSPLSGAVPVCTQRVASFLSGGLLTRPLLDLTGYWVLTLDREGSVSVLDPTVSFAGRSSLYKALQLGSQPFDWLKTADDTRLFVALPGQNEVAMIDLQSLRLRDRVALGGRPTRLALQPDGRLLWVGLRGDDARIPGVAPALSGDASPREGVVAIDARDGRVRHEVQLAPGHHEVAFSEDSRLAYASSRDSGRLTVIETASGRVLRELELGGQPLALLALPAQRRLWVIDGAHGVIHRLDQEGRQLERIALEPGLGPARLTPDGRHVLIVNPLQQRLYVLDAQSGAVARQTTITGRPYDLMFTALYVYVRALDSDQVALFPLAQLPDAQPQYIPAGTAPVSAMPGLGIASTMTPNYERSGAFFVVPAERTVYHYMEGMNAPDSSLRAFGHTPLAVTVVQRGLRELARGEYAASFVVPSSGRMVLALAADAPRIRACFGVTVSEPPRAVGDADLRVRWLDDAAISADSGAVVSLRFRVERRDGQPASAVRLNARIVPGQGGGGERWPVEHDARSGEYRVRGRLLAPGGYYVHIEPADARDRLDAMSAPAAIVIAASPSAVGTVED